MKITDNPHGTRYMRGCAKGYLMPRVVYAPDRLKRPLLRTGPRGTGSFREASWEEALDLVAARLHEIGERYGKQAILPLRGSGACRGMLHNTGFLSERFFHCYGGYTEVAGNYSAQAAAFTQPFLFGSLPTGIDSGTLQFSNLIVLWGTNIVDTRYGCEMEARIREQKDQGVPVVVIDPRFTQTAKRLGTQWIPIKPGTDSVLMAAVLYVLLDRGWVDRISINALSSGFEKLEDYIMGRDSGEAKTPQWASAICGVPPADIENFARLYGQTSPTAIIPGLSIQRTVGGEEAIRMGVALQVATGNVGIPGGSSGGNCMYTLPFPRCGNIKVKKPQPSASTPMYRWPDAVLEGEKGGYPTDIKCIYNAGGNHLCQGSDIGKNIKAFNMADFSVCHDYFLTPTARYCDVVLPATTFLEREDIIFTESNYLLYSQQAIQPLYSARNDYDIFRELSDRLGFEAQFSAGMDAKQWLSHFLEVSEVEDIESFKNSGIYFGHNQLRVGLADFRDDPNENRLDTPSGKIEIRSARFAQTGFSSMPECRYQKTRPSYPLRLVTPKSSYRIHSQNYNVAVFKKMEKDLLWMNPVDAEDRHIEDNQQVMVTSEIGCMLATAFVTEDIMPGVASIYEGVWPTVRDDGLEIAGSANTLTSTEPTLPSQGARTHSVLVEIRPYNQ